MITDIECPIERWKATSNNIVDQLAKSAVTCWEPVFTIANHAYDEIQNTKAMRKGLCDLLVKIGVVAF